MNASHNLISPLKRNLAAVATLLVVVTLASGAKAQVTGYNLFEEDFLTQTGDSTVTSDTWAATANLTLSNPGDAANVDAFLPDGTDDSLTPSATDPTVYAYRGTFSSQADMEAVFPTGSVYTYTISGGTQGSDSGMLTFPVEGPGAGDLSYPSAIPSFTNYSSFQNLNSAQAFTFNFSGFQALTGTSDQSLVFFDIYNPAGTDVFSDDFLSASTTSVTVAGGTLMAGTTYTVDLDYSNRQTTTDAGFADGIDPFAGLDYNTSASFTTAFVPEPGTVWMLVAGVGLLLGARRLRLS